jgi:hypothetical protein
VRIPHITRQGQCFFGFGGHFFLYYPGNFFHIGQNGKWMPVHFEGIQVGEQINGSFIFLFFYCCLFLVYLLSH